MTWEEFRKETMPLAIQLGAEWDSPTWRLYHRAVQDVPIVLYVGALEQAAKTRTKFPAASQVLALAEERRKALMDAHPYERCDDCHRLGQVRIKGTMPPQYRPCACRERYHRRLSDLGITTEPLALPAGRVSEWAQAGEQE